APPACIGNPSAIRDPHDFSPRRGATPALCAPTSRITSGADICDPVHSLSDSSGTAGAWDIESAYPQIASWPGVATSIPLRLVLAGPLGALRHQTFRPPRGERFRPRRGERPLLFRPPTGNPPRKQPLIWSAVKQSWMVCYCACPHAESGALAEKVAQAELRK